MAMQTYNLGPVTAYGDARAGGYAGTLAEWQALMANYAIVGQQATQSAQIASTKALEALNSANNALEAQTGAETAAQSAQEAENNAETAAASAQIRYGSPLVAQTVADMVNENRVYVYVGSESGYTNGNWYYYNGTAWASGGVYNGAGINTDTTLTQSGMAADAKVVGDELNAIKEEFNTRVNLPITRVISTTYMDDTAFNRLKAFKKNGMLYLYFNAEFATTGYSVSEYETIAHITGWNAIYDAFATIPNQNDGSKIVTLAVSPTGDIKVYSTTAITKWHRASICIPCSSQS